ncbi:MAG: histone deacetylase [Chloroflexi bacterium]|nr:histone deacetylase [Chloroflexota bacterium]
MKTVIITAPDCDRHATGGHIEAVARRPATLAYLEQHGHLADRLVLTPEPATDTDLERVHSARYIRAIGEMARSGGGWLDFDTIVTPGSDVAARAAAGAALLAVAQALGGARRALALVRPPGHHALAARGMGFCLYNSVAIATAAARATHGLDRVLIVDWDVHHGNGTQAIFEIDPRVCVVSLHQWPFYPGTGAAEERGTGAGLGTTVNVPLPAGIGDAGYQRVLREIVAPIARRFRPELVLVSAGYDAHAADPLGGMWVTSAGFGALTQQVVALADELCGGRVAFVLEGGYNLEALAESVEATLLASDGADIAPGARDNDRLAALAIADVARLHGLGQDERGR